MVEAVVREESVEPSRADAGRAVAGSVERVPAVELPDLPRTETAHRPTGVGELDRCLGGGLVPGSLVLLGGEPGIGKSTLLLQASDAIARSGAGVLYVSGEESPAQVRLRSDRLGIHGAKVQVLGETDVDAIFAEVERLAPQVVVVDSIQVVHDAALGSAPGTVSQVKQVAERFLRLCKQTGTATLLIGHVTKEGALAGPRTLEHLVDTVLAFECEGGSVHRLVRCVKNRFGPAGEVGVFEMTGAGLQQVPDASRLFLSERRASLPGSAVYPSIEGTRPVMVEIQALVSEAASVPPRRTCVGFDGNRLAMLLAVLATRAGRRLSDRDVFLNVAGGMRLRESGADLAVVLALASAAASKPVPADVAAFGEVGLSGEVRSVDRAALRLREVAALGFRRCVAPRGNVSRNDVPAGLAILPAEDVASVLDALVPAPPPRS
jgi:DNA repair protein RadA/Sms